VNKALVAAALLAALGGCVTSTNIAVSEKEVAPRTYLPEPTTIERSVGMLRRLVVLPIVLQASPEDPKLCVDPCDWPGFRRGLATSAVLYLARERGYEVSSVDPDVESHASIGLEPPALAEAARRLADFARGRPAGSPSAELAALVKSIGVQADVDGVVVLHGSVTVVTWLDWAVIYGSFGMAAPIVLRATASFEADVFEAAPGRLVWAGTYSKVLGVGMAPAPAEIVTDLFDPIEPALPAIFTRPPAASRP
jgi:hypothetical protein